MLLCSCIVFGFEVPVISRDVLLFVQHLNFTILPFVRDFKDRAYYCHCAYVLRISRYSDFLSPMLTNTRIFLRGLKLSGESIS